MVVRAPVLLSAAVEGLVDEAVLRRLIADEGASLAYTHGKNGKAVIRRDLNGYNQAAYHSPWVVLIDLDHDEDCAPPVRAKWLPNPAPHIRFRIAVRQVEAWLLADRERIAKFLSVSQSQVPPQPETLPNPKETLVNLARGSRRRETARAIRALPARHRIPLFAPCPGRF